MEESISQQVKDYVDKHLHIKRCLAEGVINKSALARKIGGELGEGSFHSVHMALRRMEVGKPDGRAREILQDSRVKVRTGVGVFIGREKLPEVLEVMKEAYRKNEEFYLLQEQGVWTVIAAGSYADRLREFSFREYGDVAEVVVMSPPEIEDVPGVLEGIVSRLADRRINIIEFTSCWTDTILVISKEDIPSALEALGV